MHGKKALKVSSKVPSIYQETSFLQETKSLGSFLNKIVNFIGIIQYYYYQKILMFFQSPKYVSVYSYYIYKHEKLLSYFS